jgi:putative hydrolase of the HAD superfamily
MSVSRGPAQNSDLEESCLTMAINPIQAVLFDMGGTLENLYNDEAIRQEATRGLRELLRERGIDPGLSLPDLQATVSSGLAAYQAWRAQSEIELSAERVWTEFIFVNHGESQERLLAAADDIAFFHEAHYHTRSLRPEAPAVLEALQNLDFRLAIISNVISRQLVPHKLVEYGIAHYFDPVVTSSCVGWRKPNERIFDEAVRLMELPPKACAYVGDTVSRDVIGARRAGFGLAIQIKSFLTERSDRGTEKVPPDAAIHDLMEVVDLVTPDRERIHENQRYPVRCRRRIL